MPTRGEHVAKAGRIAALASIIEEDGSFSDWAIVAVANRALQLVEAYFAGTEAHHRSHLARNRAVRATLPAIAPHYIALQELSRIARYEADGALDQRDYELALANFAVIEADLRARL